MPPEYCPQPTDHDVTAADGIAQSAWGAGSKLWNTIVPDSALIAEPALMELAPDPIRTEWILRGAPQAASKILARSRDWLSILVVWECSAGGFKWHYTRDETLVVISGCASITDARGTERHFKPGDVVFFPAGTSYTWSIEDRIRKIAVVRESVWPPLGMAAKICKKVARTIGIGDRGE